ncbi:hypothetical protein BFJ65_g16966 [Fusarium oxysporum f. sp. cepae]|nr:hypothetical protein BFJ65_g16966 [Fusarium oxysporum f. sp. cepae]
MDIAEDVEAELQDFIRLARLELFEAASEWFQKYLSRHQSMFPVLVEHLDMLLQARRYQDVVNILDIEMQEDPGKNLAAHDETNRNGISQLLSSMKTLAMARLKMLQANALLATLEDCRRYLETEWPGDASEDASAIRIHLVEVYLGIVIAALESGLITEQERFKYTNPPWTAEGAPEWSGFCAWYTKLRKNDYHWEAHRIQSILLPQVTFEEAKETFIQTGVSEVVVDTEWTGDSDESFVLSMLVMSNTVCAYLLKAAELQPHSANLASTYFDTSRSLKAELSRNSTLDIIDEGLPLKRVDELELELKHSRSLWRLFVSCVRLFFCKTYYFPKSFFSYYPLLSGPLWPSMLDFVGDTAQGFVAVGMEVASNTTGTVHKVATDSASTTRKVAGDIASTGTKIVGDTVHTFAKVGFNVAGTTNKIVNDVGGTVKQILLGQDLTGIPNKVLYDGLGTLVKVTGDGASTVTNVLSNSSSTVYKVVKDTMSTADKIALDTKTTVLKVKDDTLATGVHAASRALSSRAADDFLKYAMDVLTTAHDAAVVDAILQVIHRSLEAMTQSLSGAALLWRAIFTNGTNEDTLGFILNHLYDLMQFLYDLVKPENVIPRFPAAAGTIESHADGFPGRDNPYNELDLRQKENRHAIIYQVQRVALTLIAILKMGRKHVQPSGLGDLKMNVSLRSDFSRDGNPPRPTYVSRLVGFPASPPNEKWLFINGIANEFIWFQHSCDKIRDTFKREVKGIYNRSDGILWDLIECCGEHSAATVKNDLIERTRSSKAAQDILERELRDALWPVDRSAPDKVVMIAHSQGCLLLRLALQTLVRENPRGSQQRRDMKERLRVFTFGNPSIDWGVIDGTMRSLSEYAEVTEHFAHKADFVAMLGVVTHCRDQDSGYDDNSVFYSTDGKGHLFGAHYPLGAEAYNAGAESTLLRAVKGVTID